MVRVGSVVWVLVILATTLAGCTNDISDDPAVGSDGTNAEVSAPGGYTPNLWLLDGVRPPTDNTVSSGAEPSILTDKFGEFVWIGDTAGLHITRDNGTSWQRGNQPFLIVADGWTLAQDDVGALYFSTTSIGWIDVARSPPGNGGFQTDWVSRFVDAAPIADRPWIGAHGDGEVALVFYDFGRTMSETCAHSTTGGVVWHDRSVMQGTPQAGNLEFDDQGRFYFSNDNGRIYRYDGACLLTRQTIEMFPDGKGAQHMIKMDVDDTGFYSAAPSPGNGAVVLAGSKDIDQYPRHVVISPPETASNTFATTSVHDGQLAVAWYGSETPGNPNNPNFAGSWNVFLTVVDDFWGDPVVRHYRLTTEPNHVGDICMNGTGCGGASDRDLLDYFMVDHDIWGGIHVAYGHDGATNNAVVRYAHLPPDVLDSVAAIPAYSVIDLGPPPSDAAGLLGVGVTP